MSAVLSTFHSATASAEHERIRRLLRVKRDAKVEIHAELRAMMERGLNGEQKFVPAVRRGARDRDHEVLTAVAHAAMDALSAARCMAQLLLVLKDSACPLIGTVRGLVRTQYAIGQSELLTDFRDEPQHAIRAELEAKMTAAMSGLADYVPMWWHGAETPACASDAIRSALDEAVCFLPLCMALRRSTCPLVDQLRALLCQQYADETYEAVASARGHQ